MNDRDQMTTLRELLRDALEIARSAPAASGDDGARAAYDQAREQISAALAGLDDFASSR